MGVQTVLHYKKWSHVVKTILKHFCHIVTMATTTPAITVSTTLSSTTSTPICKLM